MGKITQRMSKGNSIGIGVGVASLALSGYLLLSNEKEIKMLEDKNSELIQELDKQSDVTIQLEDALKEYKIITDDLSDNLKKIQDENSGLKSEIEKAKKEELKRVAIAKEVGSWETYTQTHYTSFCNTGCTGKTATGHNVTKSIKYDSMSIIAVDPKKIPLGSIVEIDDNGKISKAIAMDTGGAIKGNKIDLLVSVKDSNYAYSLGVKKVKIKIVRRGWDKV